MAVLTTQQKAKLSQHVSKLMTCDYTKAQVYAANQAIEDWFESQRASLTTAINAATSPYVFPPAIKKAMVAHFLAEKSQRELV